MGGVGSKVDSWKCQRTAKSKAQSELCTFFWSVKGCSADQQASSREAWRVEQWESRRAGEESWTYSAGNAAVRHIYCICHAELEENGKLFAKWVYDFHFDSTNWSELRLRSCFRLSCIRLLPRLLLIVNLVPCRASLPAAAAAVAAAAVCLLWFTRAELTICRPGQVLPCPFVLPYTVAVLLYFFLLSFLLFLLSCSFVSSRFVHLLKRILSC